MNEQHKLARRLDRARVELDECAESLARIVHDVENAERPTELVGAFEIAELTGMSRSSVSVYISRGVLPEPVAELACGRIWLRSDIDHWQKSRKRRKAA